MRTYLDIETSFQGRITVIGVYRPTCGFKQIWGNDITRESLMELLEETKTLTTYNGTRFDLPVINRHLGVCLSKLFNHRDLLFDCWNFRLYGGLKVVEEELGIERKTKEINGFMAMELWENYQRNGNSESLEKLLLYNQEDVLNLVRLEEKLDNFYQLDFLPYARDF